MAVLCIALSRLRSRLRAISLPRWGNWRCALVSVSSVSTNRWSCRSPRLLGFRANLTSTGLQHQTRSGRQFCVGIALSRLRSRLRAISLATMGELEVRARQRLQRFNEQMELQISEVARFQGEFDKYGLTTPNEKRAEILCRRAESEMFSGNAATAELLFQQARDLAPQCACVHAKSAAYELARNRVGAALERISEACNRVNAKTGGLCITVKAGILDVQWDKHGRLEALSEALRYEPNDPFLRHQYGVALSRVGREEDAIREFTLIIDQESKRVPLRETLIMSLTTRIINLRRLGRIEEARDDLRTARELVARYPQLTHSAIRLDELESENQG